jgi:methylated-DNA-[protein]-cysteine S-methyltransferase
MASARSFGGACSEGPRNHMSHEHFTFTLDRFPTPIGPMFVMTDPKGRLRVLDWEDHESRMRLLLRRQYSDVPAGVRVEPGRAPAVLRERLEAYFGGEVSALDAIDVATGGTPFQRAAWAALRAIPPGVTISYGELAARLGRPRAVRAVGLANGANPIGIVVPCHRVIGADASLTGYGGGLERKRWLLSHEGVAVDRDGRGRGGAVARRPDVVMGSSVNRT